MVKEAVCLLSGGLDSCVTATIAKKEGYRIYALSFSYGQKHTKELICAKAIAEYLEVVEQYVVDLDLAQFGGSSLLSGSGLDITDTKKGSIGDEIPSTYVPARNTVFLSIALALAESKGCEAIYLGINAVDYSGYPDCRPEYLKAYQEMANLATKRGVDGDPIDIRAPLLKDTKAEVVRKGLEVAAPLGLTWSCYRGGKRACGRCDSCQLRLQGFLQAGSHDPIEYGYYPKWYRKDESQEEEEKDPS